METPKIKAKALLRKSKNVLEKMREIMECNGTQNLQFEGQDYQTRKFLYTAIDAMRIFVDNIE